MRSGSNFVREWCRLSASLNPADNNPLKSLASESGRNPGLGGVGTPAADVLAYKPIFRFGLPAVWISPSQVKYYSGVAVDIRGNPIGGKLAIFKGVSIDPGNPPQFESQAAYLKRHGLFLAGEERRLKKADWEAETIFGIE